MGHSIRPSGTELTVDPREAITSITAYLQHSMVVEFRYGQAIVDIDHPYIFQPPPMNGLIIVSTGADLEYLYPEFFTSSDVTKNDEDKTFDGY